MTATTQVHRFIFKTFSFGLLFCGVLMVAQEDPKPLPVEVPVDMVQAFNEARSILARSQDQVKSAQAVVQFTQSRIVAYCSKTKQVPDATGKSCIQPASKPGTPDSK